jgi:hypothetical protein
MHSQISNYLVFFPNLAFCTTDEIAEKIYRKEGLQDPLQNSPNSSIMSAAFIPAIFGMASLPALHLPAS